MTQTKIEKRKTIEEYEKLAEKLAADRDAAHDVAERVMKENALIKGDLKRSIEQLIGMLGGKPPEKEDLAPSVAYNALVAVVASGSLDDSRPAMSKKERKRLREKVSLALHHLGVFVGATRT